MPGEGDPARSGIEGTLRQKIEQVLREGEATISDLSKLCRAPERAIPEALEHLGRSLHGRGGRLVQRPPACRDCGFEFRDRSRTSRPSRCPECRSGRLTEPLFRIEEPRHKGGAA